MFFFVKTMEGGGLLGPHHLQVKYVLKSYVETANMPS